MSKKISLDIGTQIQYDNYYEKGGTVIGPYSSHIWRTDPKHLVFTLARYKFISKMLSGKEMVLEAGCGDSFGTNIVLQTVKKVHGIDYEPLIIEDNIKRSDYGDRCTYENLDITKQKINGKFDAGYSLDVIEHIPPENEDDFMKNICNSLEMNSVFIIGTPNITSEQYASEGSKSGHINLKSGETLRELMEPYFNHVFNFSMNDELVHTGFYPMAHYIIAMGVQLKER